MGRDRLRRSTHDHETHERKRHNTKKINDVSLSETLASCPDAEALRGLVRTPSGPVRGLGERAGPGTAAARPHPRLPATRSSDSSRDASCRSSCDARRHAVGHGDDGEHQPRGLEQPEGLAFHRQRRDGSRRRHEDLRRRCRGCTRRRTGRSPPATSCSRRATIASPRSAPSSTPRRGSAPSTTRGASQSVKPQPQAPRPGAVAPPAMTGQDTVVYFFGEKIEKIGPKKYKITNGGFSTCVQPTPRWDLNAGTVILNIDHYTLLKQAVLRVKGVPVFYLPMLYYPTKREDRATGIPDPDLRNVDAARAFHFQCVFLGDQPEPGRHHRARLVLEDRSGRGQRVPLQHGRRRRQPASVPAGRACGHLRARDRPASALRSYDIRGSANQLLPGRTACPGERELLLEHRLVAELQHEHLRLVQEPAVVRRQPGRRVEQLLVERHDDHSEYFYNTTNSVISGTWPRVSFDAERTADPRLGGVLLGRQRIHAHPEREQGRRGRDQHQPEPVRRGAADPLPVQEVAVVHGELDDERRDTYYTRSYEPTGDPLGPVEDRRCAAESPGLLGPGPDRRSRVQPDLGHARQRLRGEVQAHRRAVRDPGRGPSRSTTSIASCRSTASTSTSAARAYTYGINNRFYAKRALAPGQPAQAREIFNVEISQTLLHRRIGHRSTTGRARSRPARRRPTSRRSR